MSGEISDAAIIEAARQNLDISVPIGGGTSGGLPYALLRIGGATSVINVTHEQARAIQAELDADQEVTDIEIRQALADYYGYTDIDKVFHQSGYSTWECMKRTLEAFISTRTKPVI